MFGRTWRIGRVGGIPVNVDASWIWIAVLLTYSFWSRFNLGFLGVTSGGALALALFTSALFFGSVFLHEVAHAVAARLNGIAVQGITLVIFGGFTSARSDEKGPGPAFLISAVGPGTSLALGLIFWRLSLAMDPFPPSPVAGVLGYVGWVNLLMAAFNVLPGLPLDGGRMLQAAIWSITRNEERATSVAATVGLVLGPLVVVAGALLASARGDAYLLIWGAIIGLFVFQAARASRQQIDLRRRLVRGTVGDVMSEPPPAIPSDMSLSEALDRFLRGHEGEAFPVLDGFGIVIGMVSFGSAREIGMHDPLRPVRDAIIPLTNVVTATPEEALAGVAERLGSGRAALVLSRDGRVVGAIQPGAISRWARSQPVP